MINNRLPICYKASRLTSSGIRPLAKHPRYGPAAQMEPYFDKATATSSRMTDATLQFSLCVLCALRG